MNTRKYQDDAREAITNAYNSGLGRVLTTMPTGTGKTVTFGHVINDFITHGMANRVGIIAHREELLEQAKDKVEKIIPGISVGIEAADKTSGGLDEVVIASIQTVGRPGSRRIDKLSGVDLLIIDEAHHAPADTYQNIMQYLGCYEGKCFTSGWTATPKRLDNRPLHSVHDAVFEEEVFRYELKTAIKEGYLCDIRGYRIETNTDLSKVATRGGDYAPGQLQEVVDTNERNGMAIAAYLAICPTEKAIVFCSGVEHAHHFAEGLRDQGVTAEALDGTLDKDSRRDMLARFRSGETQVLCNMEVLTEGFDDPTVRCILMLRPTQSWGLYCQMVGRGTRILPGIIEQLENHPASRRCRAIAESLKPDCIVIDVVDLTQKHELASVPGILGLPPRIDMEGQKLSEVADKMEELGAMMGRIPPEKIRKFSDIQKLITQVDLLAQIEPPAVVKRASRFSWVLMPDASFCLDCGPTPDGNGRRIAYLKPDALGVFTLYRKTYYRAMDGQSPTEAIKTPLKVGGEIAQAMRNADRTLISEWQNIGIFAARDTAWRQKPASEKQIALLNRLGVDVKNYPHLTAGDAKNLIDMKISKTHA